MTRLDFVCLTLVDPRGWVLMQERDEHAPHWPDRWCLPGGGLEGDESALAGAVRELHEETGLEVEPAQLSDLGEFEVAYDRGTFRFHCFVAPTYLGDADVECHEGRRMVFVDPDRWSGLRLVPSTAVLEPALRSWIGDHRLGPTSEQQFAGAAVVDRRGWILLQERDEHALIDPDRWGLPGGHLNAGEDPRAGALRELEEETGIALGEDDVHHVGTFPVDHRDSRGSWDRMDVFAAAVDLTDADVDCREGRRIVFVEPDAARRLDLTAAASWLVPDFLDSALYRALTVGPDSPA